MDEILPQSLKYSSGVMSQKPVGCSSIIVNGKNEVKLPNMFFSIITHLFGNYREFLDIPKML